MVSMVEQLALDFGFASQEGRYSIGGILSWSLPAMSEVPAGDRRPDPGGANGKRAQTESKGMASLGGRSQSCQLTC
jgi:hypothetical protein